MFERPGVSIAATIALLFHLYAAQGCGVVSLAEGTAVPLMQRTLLVWTGIWNLAMVPATHHLDEGHHVIFNIHQRMLADVTSV